MRIEPPPICPDCGAEPMGDLFTLDDLSAIPEAGDVTVCGCCGVPLEFTEALSLIHIRAATLAKMDRAQRTELKEAMVFAALRARQRPAAP